MVATSTAIAAAAVAASAAGTIVSATSAGGSSAPKPPNYTKQIVKGNAAEAMVLPDKLRSELAARQQFDIPALLQSLGYMDASNAGVQEQRLSAAEAFAPREIQQRKALVDMADPGKLEMRDEVGKMVLEELKKGRELTTAQSQSLRDTVRGRQVSSGITDGSMPVLEEGLAMERYKDETRSRRLAEAGSFLAMPSLAEMSAGMPTGYNPMSNSDSFRLYDPRAGQAAADYASRNYATQTNAPDRANGWVQGLGVVAGAASRYAGWSATQPQQPQAGASGATNSWMRL